MSEINTTTKTETVNADWCEHTVPELVRFNKAFVKRRGKGFAHVIVLKADDEKDITCCYEKERAFFEINGWSCVLIKGDNTEAPPRAQNTLLFRTIPNKNEVYNIFDVTGIRNSNADIEKLVDMIGFDDLTMEFLNKVDSECIKYLLSKVTEVGMERFVNDLIMNHYNKTDSDFMTKDDIIMMFGTANIIHTQNLLDATEKNISGVQSLYSTDEDERIKTESNVQAASANHYQKEKSEIKAAKSPQNKEAPEKKSTEEYKDKNISPLPYEEKINSHSIKSNSKGGFLGKHGKFRPVPTVENKGNVVEQKPAKETYQSESNTFGQNEKMQNSELLSKTKSTQEGTNEKQLKEPDEILIEKQSDNDIPKVPAPVKVKKILFQSKEKLSDEDKKSNAEFLHNIRSKYEETLQFVRDLHSPQFTVFINLLNEALNGNKYTKQWCPIYLDLTDDLTTDLYAKLYELDQITAEFNKKLIHQVMHLGCPFCANEWDEDVTFIDTGMHYTRCPKCGNERPIMKEE